MALIWMDGFDHYGAGVTGIGNMLDGVYAEALGGPTASFARTGSFGMSITNSPNSGVFTTLRRVFPLGDLTIGGVGFVIWFTNLPAAADDLLRFQIVNASNSVHFSITLRTDGRLRIYRGNNSVLLYQTDVPVFVSGSWQHFEFSYVLDASAGGIECRWNGETVANVTGVNTMGTTEGAAQFRITRAGDAFHTYDAYIDDLVAWSDQGGYNNDFIGDRRVLTLYPDADTANADYSIVGAAAGYQAIDETVPNDETDYISFAAAGSPAPIGDFGLQNVPAEVAAIYAVQTYVRMRKDDAGDCNVQTSLLSGANETEGVNRAITEEWTYWMDVFETNPATGAQWTPAEFNAAQLRLTRTA